MSWPGPISTRFAAAGQVHVFLVLSLLAGPAFILFVPPMRYPDEGGHLLRAYALADGRLLLPTAVPASVTVDGPTARDATAWLQRLKTRAEGQRYADTLWLLAPPPPISVAGDDVTIPMPPAQLLSSPVAYLPAAVGLRIARVFGGEFAAQILAVRLAALATGVALSALSLRLMPFGAWIALCVSLLPSAVWLRSGHPIDSLTLGAAALMLAASLRIASEMLAGRRPGGGTFTALLAALAILALTKPVYLPGAVVALAGLRRGGRRDRALLLAVIAVGLALGLCWSAIAMTTRIIRDVPPELMAPEPRRLALLHHPVETALLFARSLMSQHLGILEQVVAWFGTNVSVRLPPLVVMAMGLPLMIATLQERPTTPGSTGLILGLLAGASGQALAITLSQYLTWTPTGATIVELQGRYFLPLLPFAAIAASLAIGRIRPRRGRWWIACCVLGAALSLAVALVLMVLRD